jgi:hypothetical protein
MLAVAVQAPAEAADVEPASPGVARTSNAPTTEASDRTFTTTPFSAARTKPRLRGESRDGHYKSLNFATGTLLGVG